MKMKKITFLSCFLREKHFKLLLNCFVIAVATIQSGSAATILASAAGSITAGATWTGGNAPVASPADANIWSSNGKALTVAGSQTFYGNTLDINSGTLACSTNGSTLSLYNVTLNGGTIYPNVLTTYTLNFQNNSFTLNSGHLKNVSNQTGVLLIQNCSLTGSGTITISHLNTGTSTNYIELNNSGVNTTGFTGKFEIVPGLYVASPSSPQVNNGPGGQLKLNAIATGSFGVSVPAVNTSTGVISNSGTFKSNIPGKFYFTAGAATVKLTSLNLGGTEIAPGVYTLAQLNDYGGTGTKTAYLNQSSTGTVTVELAAPTVVTATNVNGVASVAFTGNGNNFTVTPYNVTTSTTGTPVTGTSSPISVPGLISGNSYRFTVTVTTAGITSPASTASNDIAISAPGTVTAVAAGAINALSTWSADSSIPLPVVGDANTWSSNTKILGLATDNYIFNGGTFLLNAANFTPTINNLFLNNFTMTGGVVYPSVIGNCTFDLQNKTFTLSGGYLGTVSSGAAGRALVFQNCSLAGSGNITVYQLNAGTYENWVEFKSSVNTSGYTGTFTVVPGASGTSIGGELKLNDIATASFSVNVPAPTGTGSYTSSVPGKLFFTGNVNLKTLNLGGTNIGVGTYTLSQLNDYAGSGNLSAYLNQSSTGTVIVNGPGAAPGPPTSVVATAGNAQASIAFVAPSGNGGSTILDYTVTSNPGNITATGALSPIKVTGLSNGTAYIFTVTARNAIGSSTVSAASASVTPNATAYIIPVSSGTNISALTLTPVSDVAVAKDALLTINQLATINSLTVAAGGQVTNSNTLNAGTLILNSNETDGTATYIDNGTTNVTTAIANQYLGTTRNWYVSSPVVSTASSTSNIEKYFEYIEAGNNNDRTGQPAGSSAYWKGYTPGATFMEAGKGYIALPSNPAASLQFSGTLNKGNINVTLSKVGNGFNLIGNPYPSHLTWTLAYVTSKAAQIEPTIWIRTNGGSSNSTGWSFTTHNALVGEIVPSWADVDIAPMQAFWVKAKATGTLILDNTLVRSHNASNRLKAPAAKNTTRQRVRLQVSNGTATDEALIYFDAAASSTYDAYDSPKMFINTAPKPEISTKIGNEQLVINGMSEVPFDTEIPVGFSTLTAGYFSISRAELANFQQGTRILLKDKLYPATEFELTEGASYNFNADVTAASTDRFSLLFRAPGTSTGINDAAKLNAQVFVNATNQITIVSAEKCNYAIYNAVGQQVENGVTTAKQQTVNCKINTGVYVVKVNNQSTRVIIK